LRFSISSAIEGRSGRKPPAEGVEKKKKSRTAGEERHFPQTKRSRLRVSKGKTLRGNLNDEREERNSAEKKGGEEELGMRKEGKGQEGFVPLPNWKNPHGLARKGKKKKENSTQGKIRRKKKREKGGAFPMVGGNKHD